MGRGIPARVGFAEVQLPSVMGVTAVEARLADGTVVRGASAREVAEVAWSLRH